MGWTSFLGDLAKGFAEGYIEERGVKGTVEDVAGIAKSLFSSQDESDNDFISEYNALIDAEEYAEAYNYVNKIYNGESKDEIYYYLCAHSTNLMAINTDLDEGLQLIARAEKSINKAWNKADKGTDLYKEIKELKQTISENKNSLNKNREMLAHWDATLKKIDQLCSIDKDFSQAEKTLLDHYLQYEGGELDYYYWKEIAQIHYFKHFDSTSEEENESSYRVFLQDLDQAYKYVDNDAERAAEITSWRNWDKHKIDPKSNGIGNVIKTIADSKTSSNEDEYVAELKSCLEDDGEISERERRLLNKLRQSLGISEERAAELEAQLQNSPLSLTSEEQEYADEVKACLEDDGLISARERRLLDKVRESLGISIDRAKEIEDSIS